MIRVNDCKGIRVVCLKDKDKIGFLGDALYDAQGSVKGFLLESESGFSGRLRKKYIALEDILKLNDSVCVVYSKDSVKKYPGKRFMKTTSSMDEMIGRNVVSRSGEKLGVVHDMVFDMETGSLEGLELSKGFMNDMLEGRKVIFMRDGVEFGEEYIITEIDDKEE